MTEQVAEIPPAAEQPRVVHTLNSTRTVDGQVWVTGRGPAPAHVMMVEAFPDKADVQRRMSGCGQNYNVVRRALLRAGIQPDACYWTNLVKYIPEKKGSKDVSAADIERCKEVFEGELARVAPKYVITFGAIALKYFMGPHYAVDDFRACLLQPVGRAFKIYSLGSSYLPTKHPEHATEFLRDLKLFKEILSDFSGVETHPGLDRRIVIKCMDDLKVLLYCWLNGGACPQVLSLDCEWGKGNFKTGLLRSIQLATMDLVPYFIRLRAPGGEWAFDAEPAAVYALLKDFILKSGVKFLGHNVSEDLLWLEERLGMRLDDRVDFDTMYASHVCNEYEEVGLERLSVRYTNFGRYDVPLLQEIKDRELNIEERGYLDISDEVMIPYGCCDVLVPILCKPILINRMKTEGVYDFYTREMLGVAGPFTMELKRNGLPVDAERVKDLTAIFNKKYKELKKELQVKISEDAVQRLHILAHVNGVPLTRQDIEACTDPEMVKTKCPNFQVWTALEPVVTHFLNTRDFNINSYDHKSHFLFKVLNLMPVKTTGKPSMSWAKVKTLPEEIQSRYKPCVDNQTLELLKDDHPLVVDMWRVMRIGNMLKVFLREDGQGLLKFIQPDGRLYYDLTFLTETTRARTFKPNTQNFSKKADVFIEEIFGKKDAPPPLRTCVVAPQDHVLLEADYRTAEVFTLAYSAGDPEMINVLTMPDKNYIYLDGKVARATDQNICYAKKGANGQPLHPPRDIHWEMAEKVNKKTREFLDKVRDRTAAKIAIFGIPYGMSASTLARQIRAATGQTCSEEEAQAIIDEYYNTYPVAAAYLKQMEDIVWSGTGVVINPYGRKRRFYLGEDFYDMSERSRNRMAGMLGREARNFPIQSYVASSINTAALMFLQFRDQMALLTKIISVLHDALLFCVPKRELDLVKKLVVTCMSDGTIHDTPGGKFRLDVEMDTYIRWTEKLKGNV